MGQIRLSAAELRDFSSKSTQKRNDVDEVRQTAERTVAGTDWQSEAFSSFRDLWNRHKTTLDNLSNDLDQWSRYCQNQAGVADELNRRF